MIIQGQVFSVRYAKDGFFVFYLKQDNSSTIITVRGNLFGIDDISPGVKLRLSGDFSIHPKYGRGFNIESWGLWYENVSDIKYFLETCLDLKDAEDLDEACQLIFSLHGDGKGLRALLQGEKQLSSSVSLVLQRLVMRDFAGLVGNLLPSLVFGWVYAAFGLEMRERLEANPYYILRFPGTTLEMADTLAGRLGVTVSASLRLGGQIVLALREATSQGHVFLTYADIADILRYFDRRDLLEALNTLGNEGLIRVVDDGRIYPTDMFEFENMAAILIASRLCEESSALQVDCSDYIKNYEGTRGITLSDSQVQAIREVVKGRIFVLTGRPGTGKTTLIRAFVSLFLGMKKSVLLMAPTGIAAKRLENLTSYGASTVHRALRYDGTHWEHDEHNPLLVDVVIVDEASMVDQELIYRLLIALSTHTIVIFVGDDAQLPSVGPGNVLRELIAHVPTVHLTQIFRQSERGGIAVNAHKISTGNMPHMGKDVQSEFQFVYVPDESEVVSLIVEMAVKLKAKDANFQVLSPKYEGVVGINSLNLMLRDRLNPRGERHPSIGLGDRTLYLGDRVLVTKNLYDLDVYNGDIGKIVGCSNRSVSVRIHNSFGQERIVVMKATVAGSSLLLAYALSVHRVQGQEYDTIVMPVVQSQGRMLQRNLLYTAVTRARKRVWLIGDDEAVAMAVANDKVQYRNTWFGKKIESFVNFGRSDSV